MLHRSRAFTLIELALVLVIVSLMTGFGMQALEGTTSVNCYEITQAQLETIDTSLKNYAATNRRFPKPAYMNLGSNDADFGKEAPTSPVVANNTPAYGAAVPPGMSNSGGTLIGALPHATLGLSAQYAADCWGDKFTYAVVNTQTSSDSTTGYTSGIMGNIQMMGGTPSGAPFSGAPVLLSDKVAYVVISHGQDKFGATPLTANNATAVNCNASTAAKVDRENCNVDTTFYNSMRSTGTSSNYFDDMLIFSAKTQSQEKCPPQTVNWGTNCSGTSILVNHSNSDVVNNTAPNYGGSVNITCNDGTLAQGAGTCNPEFPCPAGTVISWGGGNCSYTTGSAATHGSNVGPFSNTGPGYNGSVSAQCVNGSYNITSQSCNPNGCAAGSHSSGSCNYPYPSLVSGASPSVPTNTPGYTGSVTVSCTAGSVSFSSPTCTATPLNCNPQAVNWGAGCTGNAGAINNSNSTSISNTNGSYVGSVTVTCNNGTLNQSGAVCNAACIADGSPPGAGTCCNADTDGNGNCGFQCRADGTTSSGNPALCCNGDSDGNGTCGTQIPAGTCAAGWSASFVITSEAVLPDCQQTRDNNGNGNCTSGTGGTSASTTGNTSECNDGITGGGPCSLRGRICGCLSDGDYPSGYGTGAGTSLCCNGDADGNGQCGNQATGCGATTANWGGVITSCGSCGPMGGLPACEGPDGATCSVSGQMCGSGSPNNRVCAAPTRCSGSVPALGAGASTTVSNSAGGYTGNVVATCSSGTVVYSSYSCATASSCTPAADGQAPAVPCGCQNTDTDGNGLCGFQCVPNMDTPPAGNAALCCSGQINSGTGRCRAACNAPSCADSVTAPTGCMGDGVWRDNGTVHESCCSGVLTTTGSTGAGVGTQMCSCTANGLSSGGNPANCCNGDSDGNGICGTQATCSPCATYAGTEGDLYGSGGMTGCWNYTKADCSTEYDLAPCDGTMSSPPSGWSNCNACTGDGSPPGGGGCCNPDTDGNGVCGTQAATCASEGLNEGEGNMIGGPGCSLTSCCSGALVTTYPGMCPSSGYSGGAGNCGGPMGDPPGSVVGTFGGDLVCFNGLFGANYNCNCTGAYASCASGTGHMEITQETSGCGAPDCGNGDTMPVLDCYETCNCVCN